MLAWDTIQTMLFTVLCLCFVFYLVLGISSYRRDKKSKVNVIFLYICISTSFWAIGYAFMLISPTIEIAYYWRMVSAFGWCYFYGLWVSIALSLNDTNKNPTFSKTQYLIYIVLTMFFISNL